MRVLHDLHGQEEACIQAMRHARPSNISLYHRTPISDKASSLVPGRERAGCQIPPTANWVASALETTHVGTQSPIEAHPSTGQGGFTDTVFARSGA